MKETEKYRWRKEPPTTTEWIEMRNHGAWWVKFPLIPSGTMKNDEGEDLWFDDTDYIDIVVITIQYKKGHLLDNTHAKLYATGTFTGSFSLDDIKKTKYMQWQPVRPPEEDKITKAKEKENEDKSQ